MNAFRDAGHGKISGKILIHVVNDIRYNLRHAGSLCLRQNGGGTGGSSLAVQDHQNDREKVFRQDIGSVRIRLASGGGFERTCNVDQLMKHAPVYMNAIIRNLIENIGDVPVAFIAGNQGLNHGLLHVEDNAAVGVAALLAGKVKHIRRNQHNVTRLQGYHAILNLHGNVSLLHHQNFIAIVAVQKPDFEINGFFLIGTADVVLLRLPGERGVVYEVL